MDMTRDNRLLTYQEAAQYCGLTESYFRNQHKERQGPEFVKPSPRRVFFTPRALDRWMANWKVVARSPPDASCRTLPRPRGTSGCIAVASGVRLTRRTGRPSLGRKLH